MPPDAAAALVVPAGQHEIERRVRAIEISLLVRQPIRLGQAQHHPGIVVVVLVFAALGGRRFIAGRCIEAIPVLVHRGEELREQRPIGFRIVTGGGNESAEEDSVAPHEFGGLVAG